MTHTLKTKENKMNKTQEKIRKLIEKWVKDTNKKCNSNDSMEKWGILVHYHNDGSIAFDGDILDALRYMAEFNIWEELRDNLTEIMINDGYENQGLGVWNK